MEAFLGQFVKTKTHNHTGRITHKYHLFSETNEEEWWFNVQRPAIPEEAKSKPWYSILCHGGGSVMVPEEDIRDVSDDFRGEEFDNVWASFYFKDAKKSS